MKRLFRPISPLAFLFFFLIAVSGPATLLAGRIPGAVRSHPAAGGTSAFFQRAALDRLLDGSPPPIETLKVLVVRVSFADTGFASDHGYTYFSNELRHLREYYTGASCGRFTLTCDLAARVVTLPYDKAYYGEDDEWDLRVAEMLMTVAGDLDDEYDFSGYDAFALIHAGPGQESDFNGDSADQLWSGFLDPAEMEEVLADTLGTPGVPTGDTGPGGVFYIDNVMVLPEEASQDGFTFGSLGIYAYQVGMRLGMVPLYDTTPSGFPDSQGIGAFGLMAYGLYNAAGFIPAFPCAFHRYLMGWVQPVVMTSDAEVSVKDINQYEPGDTSLVMIPAGVSEYFLVDNRVHDTDFDGRFDFIETGDTLDGIPENPDTLLGAEFDFFLTSTTDPYEYVNGIKYTSTGSGLKIWHIDESMIMKRLLAGEDVNDEPMAKGVDLEEADGIQDMDRPGGSYAFGGNPDSFRKGVNDEFGPDTNPSSSSNGGVPTGIRIYGISEAGAKMSFNISFSQQAAKGSIDIEGDVTGLDPVAADLDGDGSEDLIIASKSPSKGMIYILPGAGGQGWASSAALLAEADSADWAASPVAADLDGDGAEEIVAVSSRGQLYAFTLDGGPFTLDSDGTPGSLELAGTVCTGAAAVEADGDAGDEAVNLSSDFDSIYMYISGLSSVPPAMSAGPVTSVRSVAAGIPVSDPVLARVVRDGGEEEGIFFVMAGPDSTVMLRYQPLDPGSQPVTCEVPSALVPPWLVTAASGDIDRDGSDEMAVCLPGAGLVYFDPFDLSGEVDPYGTGPKKKLTVVTLPGTVFSAPSLSDIDGDGVMETAVRSSTRMFAFTGFGIPLAGWPVTLSETVSLLEAPDPISQPLVLDIDGDGDSEILFNTAGDMAAFELSGRPVTGWPLQGAGDHTVSPLAMASAGGRLEIFSIGAVNRVKGPDPSGMIVAADSSIISRYDIATAFDPSGGWVMARHDGSGSGRAEMPVQATTREELVSPGSFICYPNPVEGSSFWVRLDIGGAATVTIRILDLEGQEVSRTVRQHPWSEGSVPFNEEIAIEGMASGVYICLVDVAGGGRSWKGAKKVAFVR